jgi:hypothetical protein
MNYSHHAEGLVNPKVRAKKPEKYLLCLFGRLHCRSFKNEPSQLKKAGETSFAQIGKNWQEMTKNGIFRFF